MNWLLALSFIALARPYLSTSWQENRASELFGDMRAAHAVIEYTKGELVGRMIRAIQGLDSTTLDKGEQAKVCCNCVGVSRCQDSVPRILKKTKKTASSIHRRRATKSRKHNNKRAKAAARNATKTSRLQRLAQIRERVGLGESRGERMQRQNTTSMRRKRSAASMEMDIEEDCHVQKRSKNTDVAPTATEPPETTPEPDELPGWGKWSSLLADISTNRIHVPAAALLGLLAGSGAVSVAHRVDRGKTTAGEVALLNA
eukprot:gnl/TRDRNA2_/TRDRNA2_33573_c0_seq1.p1 gnl/TRDRNA2_/TRDRNA2_33573_c0~~gnl/TRDRNA2_/TRDRNA2_33573_c0_seq1.p1  ORF type:complete len:258 (+),score=28.57 gnl/TRDRNA2_/TRDRNA2_33573_c0_seq1:139-912(+)